LHKPLEKFTDPARLLVDGELIAPLGWLRRYSWQRHELLARGTQGSELRAWRRQVIPAARPAIPRFS
jgi:hypothetical protein